MNLPKLPGWIFYLALAVPIWCVLAGSFHPVQIGWALVVGAITIPVCWRLLDLPRRVDAPDFLRSLLRYLRNFFVLFVPDAILSTIDMARRVIRPRIEMHPGVVAVPIRFDGHVDALLLCNHLTLTPGQLVVDYDGERGILYLHTIDARDPEAIRRGVQRLHERARAGGADEERGRS